MSSTKTPNNRTYAMFRNKGKSGRGRGGNSGSTQPQRQSSKIDEKELVDSCVTPSTPLAEVFSKNRKRPRIEYDNSRFEMLPMCGVEVRLPEGLKPYPTQKLMMVRIITSLKNKLNLLAESPTGSGKTMALLASTCSWLMQYKNQRITARDNCRVHQSSTASMDSFSKNESSMEYSMVNESNVVDLTLDENGDFSDSKEKVKEKRDEFGFITSLVNSFEAELAGDFVSSPAAVPLIPSKLEKCGSIVCTCLPRVRIYYGTRTHKQIGQVVKEFSRLPYAKEIRHTILASREQSCINENARKAPDITSYCKELISGEGLGCQHRMAMRKYDKNPKALRYQVENYGPVVFDMEDLVETLTSIKPSICPYFTSTRVLTQDADLIFCPFSYLVDPIIRNSSDVHLKNSVVILDEAHNIEDSCRETASFTFHEKEIGDALLSCRMKEREVHNLLRKEAEETDVFGIETGEEKENRIAKYMEISRSIAVITKTLEEIWIWFVEVLSPLINTSGKGPTDKRSATRTWAFMKESFVNKSLGRDLMCTSGSEKHRQLTEAFQLLAARDQTEEGSEVLSKLKPNSIAIVCVEKWLYFMEFFGSNNSTYKLNVNLEKSFTTFSRYNEGEPRKDGQAGSKNFMYGTQQEDEIWLDSRESPSGCKAILDGYKATVNLWCMSPSLTFMDAFKDSRSVILASGTLCPMDTLKTELGMEFKSQMEGDQVISSRQIFASVVPVGPSGHRLCATYRNLNDDNRFISELAAIVKSVCLTVPSGVLCFFPSYRMLDQVYEYMECNSILRQVMQRKVVVKEPRRSSDLNDVMQIYEEAILCPRKHGSHVNGAIMFAVFRGKVSEGIDFADDRARAVISVGIPFPNAMDDLVNEKKRYNDDNCKTKNILTGDQWYVTQAYRALNQGLGRCLRNKNDWGALIMVDERLCNQKTTTATSSARVSKWIRDQLVVYPEYNIFHSALTRFIDEMSSTGKESIPSSQNIISPLVE